MPPLRMISVHFLRSAAMNAAKLAGVLGIGVASNVESVRTMSSDDKIRLIVVFSKAVISGEVPAGAKTPNHVIACNPDNRSRRLSGPPGASSFYDHQ